jgi:hypothetical protein
VFHHTTVPHRGGLYLEVVPMSEPVGASSVECDLDQLHAEFLAILPRIETHALIFFRHLRCPGRRADAIQETIAISWRWFLRIKEKDKDVTEFVSTLASYAVRHVRSGRRLCGQEKSKDVLSPLAQHKHRFCVEHLAGSTRCDYEALYADRHGQDELDAYEERLRDNTQSPVADHAAFRIDYPAWLSQLGQRSREIVADMTLDLGTGELALKHRVSQGRISQMRREFYHDWRRFHREVD